MGMKQIQQAIEIASFVHKKQTRANGLEPFLNHPMRVAAIIENKFSTFANSDVISAAILHDTLEDCPQDHWFETYESILKSCGVKVAAYVEMLSKPKEKYYRNIRYLSTLSIAPQEVIVIKLADRIDNLMSLQATNWGIPKMLAYIENSVQIYNIAISRGLNAQAQQLLLEIMIAESSVKAKINRG